MLPTIRSVAVPTPHPARPFLAGPIRVAVIGCGAVAQQIHLPALAGHEQAELVALVDRDLKRAGDLARAYKVPRVLADIKGLPDGSFDAAVIATPPFHHAPAALDLIRRRVHVLVEKPMAVRPEDADEMVRAAEEHGVVLAVGFFRRLMPSVRLLRGAVESRWLGRPLAVEAEFGGFYNWGAATLGNMRKDWAGGGVLIDFGSHVLDLLTYVFPGPAEVLDYRDDAHGGVEADCDLRLRLTHGGEPVDARIELARTRKLGGRIRVRCERGTLEYRLSERFQIGVSPDGLEVADPTTGKPRPHALHAAWADEPDAPWSDTMRAEFDDWLGAIRDRREPELSGRSSLATVRLIDDCYRDPKPLPEPWVSEELDRFKAIAPGPARRVLVTGASGFIGARVAEILHLGLGWDVRAQVHDPANAARLARLPVELVQADLRSDDDVRKLAEGCDAVINCAVGTAYGQPKEIERVTVGGTRRLLDAARRAGVGRLVHLSTIAVHDQDLTGDLDERTPVRPAGDYGLTKAAAERAVLAAAAGGLPATVVRPGCVYGPFSRTFTIRPIEGLAAGRFRWVKSADAPSNTVYVDNLVEVIVRSLTAPEAAVRGEVFTVSDGDALTWREFVGYFADALGFRLPSPDVVAPTPRPAGTWAGRWVAATRSLVGSPELRGLARKALFEHPVGAVPRWALATFPGLERAARRLAGADKPTIFHKAATGGGDWAALGSSPFLVRVDKARRVLGYDPVVPRTRALELTLEWVRHARIAS